MVTYPCPYRIIDIGADQKMVVRTERVTSIPSHPADFQEFARNYLFTGIAGIAMKSFMEYDVSKTEAEMLSKQVAARSWHTMPAMQACLPGRWQYRKRT